MRFIRYCLTVCTLCLLAVSLRADDSGVVTFDSVPEELEDIVSDEPMAEEFSAENAARYIDRAALTWQKKKKCATCHTNMAYMFARPALAGVLKDSGEVRAFYEDYPKVRWAKKVPGQGGGFWPIVVGAGLTFNDLQTTGKLSDVARQTLDTMWQLQREDGGWRWPHCDYAPMEIDDHYGVTIAALAVGIAPDGYAQTPQSKAGLEKMREYFKNDPPKSLHHRAMLAWVSKRIDGIVDKAQQQATLKELLALQLPDGGWSTAAFLTDWRGGIKRSDGEPLAVDVSDGYGTGFVIVVARELGVAADDARLQKGIAWLKGNQRESGKWFTRSPVEFANNLISNIGSAFAVLALQSCGELPGWPLDDKAPDKSAAAVPVAGEGDAVIFSDPFSAEEKVPARRAIRGDWQVANGVAVCTQDEALYKKFKDHGPVIFYDVPTTDSVIRFSIRPEDCKSFVFTLNDADGHVFRFVTGERGTSVRAFPPVEDHKSIQAARSDEWVITQDEWLDIEVIAQGKTVSVRFGDAEPVVVEHDTYAKPKTNMSIGFAFGSFSVKGFRVTSPDAG